MLVLRPGALGDTLLAVPALRALHRARLPVTLAAHPGAARLLEALNEIDRGLPFDDPSLGRLFSEGTVTGEDVVAWTSTRVVGARVQAPSRPPDRQHCARYLLSTLSPLGIDLAFDDQPLALRPIVSDEVLIHPGSGSPNKNWPVDHFNVLINALDGPVRVIVGEADHEVAAEFRCPGLEQPSLEVLAARLAGCRAYLGNDSGVSHLAGLSGAPTFALFGPTDPAVWAPIGPNVSVVPWDADPVDLAKLIRAA